GKETLLVVEDEEMVRDLACEVLKEYGYNVLEASTGPEAIEIGKRHAGTIHLLVTDMVMPGMSGIETAQKLAAFRPGIPILYISGYSREAILQMGDAIPAGTFLQKPITPTNLLSSVREILLRNGCPSSDPPSILRGAGVSSGPSRSRG
ncbi:MAG TPA: response regulator, partial [Candidatus Deferrimicrobiaceae bacterium]